MSNPYPVVRAFVLIFVVCCKRWKNTLFVGVDACFKLKLKDRKFDDPDLGTGLAYMVEDAPYQEHLKHGSDLTETVRF